MVEENPNVFRKAEEFLQERLPQILAGKKALQVVVEGYGANGFWREVKGMKTGQVAPGLTVVGERQSWYSGVPVMFVIYGGSNGQASRAMEEALFSHEQYPKAQILVMVCGCDAGDYVSKQAIRRLNSGTISFVTRTTCRGREIPSLIDAIIERWQSSER